MKIPNTRVGMLEFIQSKISHEHFSALKTLMHAGAAYKLKYISKSAKKINMKKIFELCVLELDMDLTLTCKNYNRIEIENSLLEECVDLFHFKYMNYMYKVNKSGVTREMLLEMKNAIFLEVHQDLAYYRATMNDSACIEVESLSNIEAQYNSLQVILRDYMKDGFECVQVDIPFYICKTDSFMGILEDVKLGLLENIVCEKKSILRATENESMTLDKQDKNAKPSVNNIFEMQLAKIKRNFIRALDRHASKILLESEIRSSMKEIEDSITHLNTRRISLKKQVMNV